MGDTGSMFCRDCGYDLRGLDDGLCPECGCAFNRLDDRTFRKTPRSRWRFLPYFIMGIISIWPLLITASFYLCYLAGRIALGRWPRPSLDDPKSIGIDFFYYFSGIALMTVPMGMVAALGLTIYALVIAVMRNRFLPLLFTAVTYLAWIAFFIEARTDHFDVWDWWFD